MKKAFKNSSFWVKLTNWEYWPFSVVYFSVMLYHCWLSIRAKSFFFFSTSNPSIELGGMLGESKSGILNKIPEQYKANFILIKYETTFHEVIDIVQKSKFFFPIIAKPDVGERGQGVKKISSNEELIQYHLNTKANYIIQEFIDYDIELGVFYYRYPSEENGNVSSVVVKEFLKVTGDGVSTLKQLIENYPRARFVKKKLFHDFENMLSSIPSIGNTINLEGIGNHCRGTTFLDGKHLIDAQFTKIFDQISKQIEGFYYGRFDLRCKTIADLLKGENIKIVELNGCGAEPAHIYQPGFSFFEGQKVLLTHHRTLFDISMENHQKGLPFATLSQIVSDYKSYKLAIKNISNA